MFMPSMSAAMICSADDTSMSMLSAIPDKNTEMMLTAICTTFGKYSFTLTSTFDTACPTASPIFIQSPSAEASALVRSRTMPVMSVSAVCLREAKISPVSICRPSSADFQLRSVPARPDSIVPAISSAAPAESLISASSSANRPLVDSSSALTAAISRLLKIVLMAAVFSSCDREESALFRSPMMVSSCRMLPSAS